MDYLEDFGMSYEEFWDHVEYSGVLHWAVD